MLRFTQSLSMNSNVPHQNCLQHWFYSSILLPRDCFISPKGSHSKNKMKHHSECKFVHENSNICAIKLHSGRRTITDSQAAWSETHVHARTHFSLALIYGTYCLFYESCASQHHEETIYHGNRGLKHWEDALGFTF